MRVYAQSGQYHTLWRVVFAVNVAHVVAEYQRGLCGAKFEFQTDNMSSC